MGDGRQKEALVPLAFGRVCDPPVDPTDTLHWSILTRLVFISHLLVSTTCQALVWSRTNKRQIRPTSGAVSQAPCHYESLSVFFLNKPFSLMTKACDSRFWLCQLLCEAKHRAFSCLWVEDRYSSAPRWRRATPEAGGVLWALQRRCDSHLWSQVAIGSN